MYASRYNNLNCIYDIFSILGLVTLIKSNLVGLMLEVIFLCPRSIHNRRLFQQFAYALSFERDWRASLIVTYTLK